MSTGNTSDRAICCTATRASASSTLRGHPLVFPRAQGQAGRGVNWGAMGHVLPHTHEFLPQILGLDRFFWLRHSRCPMTFKGVFRFDSSWPKLRLFRVMWNRGLVGDGSGYSRKVSVALTPRLLQFNRSWDGWRLVVLGVEVHSRISWGGRFV